MADLKSKQMKRLMQDLKPTQKADDDELGPDEQKKLADSLDSDDENSQSKMGSLGDWRSAADQDHKLDTQLDRTQDAVNATKRGISDQSADEDDPDLDDIPDDRKQPQSEDKMFDFKKSGMGASDITKELVRLRQEVEKLKQKKPGDDDEDELADRVTPEANENARY